MDKQPLIPNAEEKPTRRWTIFFSIFLFAGLILSAAQLRNSEPESHAVEEVVAEPAIAAAKFHEEAPVVQQHNEDPGQIPVGLTERQEKLRTAWFDANRNIARDVAQSLLKGVTEEDLDTKKTSAKVWNCPLADGKCFSKDSEDACETSAGDKWVKHTGDQCVGAALAMKQGPRGASQRRLLTAAAAPAAGTPGFCDIYGYCNQCKLTNIAMKYTKVFEDELKLNTFPGGESAVILPAIADNGGVGAVYAMLDTMQTECRQCNFLKARTITNKWAETAFKNDLFGLDSGKTEYGFWSGGLALTYLLAHKNIQNLEWTAIAKPMNFIANEYQLDKTDGGIDFAYGGINCADFIWKELSHFYAKVVKGNVHVFTRALIGGSVFFSTELQAVLDAGQTTSFEFSIINGGCKCSYTDAASCDACKIEFSFKCDITAGTTKKADVVECVRKGLCANLAEIKKNKNPSFGWQFEDGTGHYTNDAATFAPKPTFDTEWDTICADTTKLKM